MRSTLFYIKSTFLNLNVCYFFISLSPPNHLVGKWLSGIFLKNELFLIKANVPKKEYTIILPYLGLLSKKIQRRIKRLFKEFIPAGKINIIFRSKRRLSNFFTFKDKIHTDLSSYSIFKSKTSQFLRRSHLIISVKNCLLFIKRQFP